MAYSIIQKSQLEGANRLDAEYYVAPSGLKNNYILGKNIIDFVQYGTSEELNEEGKGFPILRLNEFQGYFIDRPAKWSDKINKRTFENLNLHMGDILICRTNGNPKLVGKSAIVLDEPGIAFASYLFRIRPRQDLINSASLVVFLNSRYGRKEIEKNLKPSNQSNFSPATFKEIRIPILDIGIQKLVKQTLLSAYEENKNADKLYKDAENLLLEKLGLKGFELPEDLTFMVNLSDVQQAHRMDADYFRPKYQRIIDKIEKKKKMSEMAKRIKTSVKFIPDTEYNYIEISDVNVSNGEVTFNKILEKMLPANAKIALNGGELIISKVRPTRGAIAIIPQEFNDNFVASGAFSIFNVDYPTREYLQVVFRSIIGKLQLEKPTTGTSYPTITDEDIENLWIPDLSIEIQQKIADLVRRSHEARKKSKELLEEAKSKVEEMIERGNDQIGV